MPQGAGSDLRRLRRGLLPGNPTDQQPVYSPLDLNPTYGNTCSFKYRLWARLGVREIEQQHKRSRYSGLIGPADLRT